MKMSPGPVRRASSSSAAITPSAVLTSSGARTRQWSAPHMGLPARTSPYWTALTPISVYVRTPDSAAYSAGPITSAREAISTVRAVEFVLVDG
ncbi:hypothetical protein GCM10020221_17470 [Streptomyces thioluteus]|uniref:Uncharacterized protein n=1 Tax=Streptomyces thioluteus TaxID=66431 RepID=A0ABN3WQD0_STRTU